jgi:hypothetical protein
MYRYVFSLLRRVYPQDCCYLTQVDHACRKEWDSYVQKLETVEVDPETGTEVVHWVMKFPVCQ